jgi:hypothetical protein
MSVMSVRVPLATLAARTSIILVQGHHLDVGHQMMEPQKYPLLSKSRTTVCHIMRTPHSCDTLCRGTEGTVKTRREQTIMIKDLHRRTPRSNWMLTTSKLPRFGARTCAASGNREIKENKKRP